jgi:hypothetical protein
MQQNFSVIHRIVMGADYNVPDKSESQKDYIFLFKNLLP